MPAASFFYTGQIINGLLDTAKIYKYNIMLHSTSAGISEMTDVIENIIKSHADGVVIFNDKLNQRGAQHAESLQCADRRHRQQDVRMRPSVRSSSITRRSPMSFACEYIKAGKTDISLVEDSQNPSMINQIRERPGARVQRKRAWSSRSSCGSRRNTAPRTLFLSDYYKIAQAGGGDRDVP